MRSVSEGLNKQINKRSSTPASITSQIARAQSCERARPSEGACGDVGKRVIGRRSKSSGPYFEWGHEVHSIHSEKDIHAPKTHKRQDQQAVFMGTMQMNTVECGAEDE